MPVMVAFRGITTAGGTGTSAAGTIPTGTTVGDVMLAFVSHNSSNAVTTAPAGWTELNTNPGAGDFAAQAFWKLYEVGDSAPAWTWDLTGDWAADVVSYSGVDTAGPVNTSTSESTTNTTASSIALGPITPTVADCVLVTYAGADAGGSGRTWTLDGAMTERIDQQTATTWHVIADEPLAGGSGTPVSRTATIAGTAQHLSGWLIALAPAPAGGGDVTGSGSSALPAVLAVVAAGALALSGAASSALPGLQAGGSAQLRVTGAAASTLPVVVGSSGGGQLELDAAGASSLPQPTGSGTGELRLAGTSSVTLPVALTAGGGGAVGSDLTGTGSTQLPAPAAAGTGELALQGVSGASLGTITASGQGNTGEAATGAVASVLARPVASAAGTLALAGTSTTQLPAARAGGAGVLSLQGAGAVTLPRPTATGSDLIVDTPAERTWAVPLEDRTVVVRLEDRTVVALPELRQPSPTPDSRTVIA